MARSCASSVSSTSTSCPPRCPRSLPLAWAPLDTSVISKSRTWRMCWMPLCSPANHKSFNKLLRFPIVRDYHALLKILNWASLSTNASLSIARAVSQFNQLSAMLSMRSRSPVVTPSSCAALTSTLMTLFWRSCRETVFWYLHLPDQQLIISPVAAPSSTLLQMSWLWRLSAPTPFPSVPSSSPRPPRSLSSCLRRLGQVPGWPLTVRCASVWSEMRS